MLKISKIYANSVKRKRRLHGKEKTNKTSLELENNTLYDEKECIKEKVCFAREKKENTMKTRRIV